MKPFYLCLLLVFFLANFPSHAKPKKYDCSLIYNLKSWSVFYKNGKGTGQISCDDGSRFPVIIKAHGGGVTFGKSKIHSGKGSFTGVDELNDLFGSYVYADAHAGATKSVDAKAMTKGDISLVLSGAGEGIDLGFAFGSFKIIPVKKR